MLTLPLIRVHSKIIGSFSSRDKMMNQTSQGIYRDWSFQSRSFFATIHEQELETHWICNILNFVLRRRTGHSCCFTLSPDMNQEAKAIRKRKVLAQYLVLPVRQEGSGFWLLSGGVPPNTAGSAGSQKLPFGNTRALSGIYLLMSQPVSQPLPPVFFPLCFCSL